MTSEVATGYDAVAIRLGRHIRNYVPKGFCKNIANFDFTPSFAESESEDFHNAFKEGSLKEYLEHPKDFKGLPREFKSYVQEAIFDFFDSKLHLQDLE